MAIPPKIPMNIPENPLSEKKDDCLATIFDSNLESQVSLIILECKNF